MHRLSIDRNNSRLLLFYANGSSLLKDQKLFICDTKIKFFVTYSGSYMAVLVLITEGFDWLNWFNIWNILWGYFTLVEEYVKIS